MKPFLLFAFSALLITGCTTAYKTGQTPDDVYYSPTRPQEEYADTDTDKDKDEKKEYRYDDEYYDDRYLRMKVRNRYRWSDLDEWYGYDRYSLGYNYVFASYNNPYNAWHYYNNPYCCCKNNILVVNSKIPPATPVVKRHFNLAGYNNTNYNNNNTSSNTIKTPTRSNTRPVYNNSNDGLSNKVKTIFDDNSRSGSSRTYTPASSSGSSGNNNSSSGGTRSGNSSNTNSSSSGAVTRPKRN